MESLAQWLNRLSAVTPGNVAQTRLRMIAPGLSAMNFDHWLFTTEQPTLVPPGFRAPHPESMVLMSYLDDAQFAQNASHHHRLSADIAAAMSLALERRVEIPYEFAVRVEDSPTISFLPYLGIVDRTTSGPLPANPKALIEEVFVQALGLSEDDLAVIGAATSMFHGAITLSGTDIQAAYTLLVAGIEALSRKYGEPPVSWSAWDLSGGWDTLMDQIGLTPIQSNALRDRLMQDLQQRLKATFRAYASSRLRPSFWDQAWIEWLYPYELPAAKWGEPTKTTDAHIRDFLPTNRQSLSRALGNTYDLRSSYVHKGRWIGLLDLAHFNPTAQLDTTRPLPFSVLRAILRELIRAEMEEHSAGRPLPDVQLIRDWSPEARRRLP